MYACVCLWCNSVYLYRMCIWVKVFLPMRVVFIKCVSRMYVYTFYRYYVLVSEYMIPIFKCGYLCVCVCVFIRNVYAYAYV